MATTQELVDQLMARVTALESEFTAVKQKTDVVREVKQVVFDREGSEVKVRAKVIFKSATAEREEWEDVTAKFIKAKREEILNGA